MEEDSSLSHSEVTDDKNSSISLSTSKLLLLFSSLTFLLLFSNLSIACLTNFTCSKFIPSPGYLGCFRGYDRVFIVSCTLFSFTLPLFYGSAYINFRARLSEVKKKVFIALSVTSSICLPLLSLTDEVIGVHAIPLIKIYNLCSSCFIVSNLIICYLIYKEISNFQVSLKEYERKWLWVLRGILLIVILLILFDCLQWKYAYSEYHGEFFNENAQSKTEWLLTAIGLFLPPLFSVFFRDSNVHFSLKLPESAAYNEIELSGVPN